MNQINLRQFAICVAAFLSIASWGGHTHAQARDQSGCCEDRWDPAKSERGRWGQGKMGQGHHQRMQRHWTFMHEGIPSDYRSASNPVIATSANIKAGAVLYRENCARCHGHDGMGDGEVGRTLSPSPALLAFMVQRPKAVDGYLLWSVSEGGAQFDTAMPAFRSKLTRKEIWQIIIYMRSGLPQFNQ